jgi:uncharacterized protein
MKPIVFVDTSFLVALLDPRDSEHRKALSLVRKLHKKRTGLLSSDAILLELANYFSRSPLRSEAIAWIDAIRANAEWEIISLERPLVLQGESRYRRYRDKSWSLTDCISMEVMEERGLAEVATADKDFAQAGFRVLMR